METHPTRYFISKDVEIIIHTRSNLINVQLSYLQRMSNIVYLVLLFDLFLEKLGQMMKAYLRSHNGHDDLTLHRLDE